MPKPELSLEQCPIIDAATIIYKNYKGELNTLPEEETQVGDFMLSRNSARVCMTCSHCSGHASVRVIFDELESQAEVSLSELCPRKPEAEDAPALYHVNLSQD